MAVKRSRRASGGFRMDTWPKYTLTALGGLLAGILATHSQHGREIQDLRTQITNVQSSLSRMEDSLKKLSEKH